MTIDADSSLTDVAFAVCTALHRAGILAVLTGGSAASYYVPAAYQSRDADFILRYGVGAAAVRRALTTVGFTQRSGGDFAHPTSLYTVEFPPGPLAIGSDIIRSWATEHRNDEILHVLSPTDVIRDRFLHYFAWSDLSSFSSAVTIARSMDERIDWPVFEIWARREAADDSSYDLNRLDRFLRELGKLM